MRLILAFRMFFAVLFRPEVARLSQQMLERAAREKARKGKAPPSPEKPPKPAPPPTPKITRSEALTLLATLQREARFVDLVQEPLTNYSDSQIGAAARDVLRDCSRALQRMFGIEPFVAASEGANVEVPAGYEPACYRLTGNVTGEPPFQGRLVHPGWQATRCELPSWSGGEKAARVIAAAEVELK